MRKQIAKQRPSVRLTNALKKKKKIELPRLMFDRDETIAMTGLSIATLIRLEAAGKLIPVKPSGCKGGKTFYTSQILAALTGNKMEEVA